jgi:hypothetical protein
VHFASSAWRSVNLRVVPEVILPSDGLFFSFDVPLSFPTFGLIIPRTGAECLVIGNCCKLH